MNGIDNIMINLIIISSIACSALAQIMLKLGMSNVTIDSITFENLLRLFLNPFILAGVALYVTAMLIWLYVLKQVEVSYAYPFTALGFVMVMVISYFFLAEQVTLLRVAGITLIIGGIFLISKGA